MTTLRLVVPGDVPVFYEHQADAGAATMVGFVSRSQPDHDAHWTGLLADPTAFARTVVAGTEVVGNIVSWVDGDDRFVGYWIGRPHWGRGHATAALREVLRLVPERPLTALVAETNLGSIRVLERCGFVAVGTHQAEGDPIVEVRMVLDAPGSG